MVRARIVADIVSAYERADESKAAGHGAGRTGRGGAGRPTRARGDRGGQAGGA